ncbi:hypothetical protein [Xenorhabdus griffiniae]|uniref:Lipoprotein n=1 Tax=Xenorhabdus griffiniae TaxID=351672 RepID=A0ABY9XDG0_9GAMM|nr:hypothetical protein [Xenorhabdus griffiniae]MBD1229268.1 hypothetical protein [Xenorhabdus griffiniae]MBE8588899.1 hypothetical protein [Xenorhabdus griffiniae]WMV70952.1 hypothetical protein QL128_12140 [Xenorhabdus griffiniae]WNH00628.1 hypothetical protein QL112_012145 [Xenorhabdus griffiniae]
MKKLLFIVFSFISVGCTTTSLESQDPIYAGETTKSAEQVNKCLAPKWIELRASSNSIPTGTGYKLVSSDDIFGALSVAVINEKGGGGSTVKVYAASKGTNDPWGNAARQCM